MITSIKGANPLFDLNQSIFVGDILSDIECGKRARVKSNFLINTNTNDIIKQFDKIINKL